MDSLTQLKQYISSFTFKDCARGDQGFSRVLIQLFGFTGNGKSSFINTCLNVMEDKEFKTRADTSRKRGGNTRERISYRVTDTITLVDNRGLGKLDSYESGEIFAQLGNLLPLDQAVEWHKGYAGNMERIVRAEKMIKYSDFIYPVYVHSVKKDIAPEQYEELRQLLTTARDLTGIFPYVVLTHKTTGDLAGVTKSLKQMGVERFFALENFTLDDHMKTRSRFNDVLSFFCEVIQDIQFRVDRLRDSEKERMDRKEFVLNYIHEREIRQQQRMTEEERVQEQMKEEREIRKKMKELQLQKDREAELLEEIEELKMQQGKKKRKRTKIVKQSKN